MKQIITSLLLLITLAVSAQGVDPILLQLLQENQQTVSASKGAAQQQESLPTVCSVDTLDIQQRVNVSFNPDGSIRRLSIIGTLADGQTCPDSDLNALGIKTICKVGHLVIMDVPADAFDALSQMPQFKWLAADHVHQLSNDKARETNTVRYVNNETSYAALGENRYTGSGVVVGVIDIGIDFNHVAFKKESDGTTRIKEAITFKKGSNEPIITKEETLIADLTTGNTSNSHGTHTSATAAGSYVAQTNLHGMAPEADLVLADCSNTLSDAHIIASASEIVKYAKTVGKPCAINVSLGDNTYFHDGSNAIADAFNTLSSSVENHCIFVVSAGNEGSKQMSIQKTLNGGETLKTILDYSGRWQETDCANYSSGLSAFIYATDGNGFTVDYNVVDITNGQIYSLEEKPLMLDKNTAKKVTLDNTVTATKNELNNKYSVKLSTSACHFTEPNLRLAVMITPSAENQKFVMTSNKLSLVGKETTDLDGYAEGNSDMSINTIACTDGVISVGSYMDRDTWTSIDGHNYYTTGYKKYDIGSVAPYSSFGVDDNGKSRPDVVAPGTYIVSAYNTYDNTTFTGDNINERTVIDAEELYITHILRGEGIGDGQRPYFYGSMSGTSMAAPMVTGIIALWLQKDPTLTTAQVRELLRTSSIQDQYTTIEGKIPSGNILQAGCGKIDALRGILTLENETREDGTKISLDETFTMPAGRNITTFSSTNRLDFRNPNGPKAYVASSIDGNTLTFKRVLSRIGARTGLLITAEAGAYNIPIAPTAETIETNYLYGTAETTYTAEEEGSIYVLSSQNGQIGFYQNAANLTVPLRKAYLKLPEETAGNAKAITFGFDESGTPVPSYPNGIALPEEEVLESMLIIEDGVTDIQTVFNRQTTLTDIYDLQGRRVIAPTKGLYIMGGKKVLFE